MALFGQARTSAGIQVPISANDVVLASTLASAAYKDNRLLASDWSALTTELGTLASGRFDEAGYFNGSSGAAAIVLRNGNQLVISFRGTDDSADRLQYLSLGGNSYINLFSPLLDAVSKYLAKSENAGLEVLITGHSLGGAAVNILRDVSLHTGSKYAAFKDAEYIAFASPKIAASGQITNIGFENDGVYKYIGGYKDYASTNDNIVVFDDAYGSSTWPGFTFDLSDTTVHSSLIYKDVMNRIASSTFYGEMDPDAPVIVVNTNLEVSDKQVRTSDHYGKDAYFIGRDVADKILGGAGADKMEGFGGNDTLRGQGGNDRLLGDGDVAGGIGIDGSDRLSGGVGNDRLAGGGANDTFRFDTALNSTTNVDRILDFDPDDLAAAGDSFDTIELENAIFSRLTNTGDLAASKFACVADETASDNGSTVTYVSSSGCLYYDTNGASDGAAILFAKLGAGLALSSADFIVT